VSGGQRALAPPAGGRISAPRPFPDRAGAVPLRKTAAGGGAQDDDAHHYPRRATAGRAVNSEVSWEIGVDLAAAGDLNDLGRTPLHLDPPWLSGMHHPMDAKAS